MSDHRFAIITILTSAWPSEKALSGLHLPMHGCHMFSPWGWGGIGDGNMQFDH